MLSLGLVSFLPDSPFTVVDSLDSVVDEVVVLPASVLVGVVVVATVDSKLEVVTEAVAVVVLAADVVVSLRTYLHCASLLRLKYSLTLSIVCLPNRKP